jgi:arginine:ornithine antiporter/lysine permease
MAIASGASAYGLWLLYASGPLHLLLSVVLYAPGVLLFLFARRGGRGTAQLNVLEKGAMALLVVASAPAMWMLVR